MAKLFSLDSKEQRLSLADRTNPEVVSKAPDLFNQFRTDVDEDMDSATERVVDLVPEGDGSSFSPEPDDETSSTTSTQATSNVPPRPILI